MAVILFEIIVGAACLFLLFVLVQFRREQKRPRSPMRLDSKPTPSQARKSKPGLVRSSSQRARSTHRNLAANQPAPINSLCQIAQTQGARLL